MQCSRCRSTGYKERRVVRRPGLPAHLIPKVEFDESRLAASGFISPDDSESAAVIAKKKSRFSGFTAQYKSSLIIDIVAGLFCATALLKLSFSVLHLGVAAIPFLGLFFTGLSVSIALPFKLYMEYKA